MIDPDLLHPSGDYTAILVDSTGIKVRGTQGVATDLVAGMVMAHAIAGSIIREGIPAEFWDARLDALAEQSKERARHDLVNALVGYQGEVG